jgi:quercetin dioxygenase-like cupin family protein
MTVRCSGKEEAPPTSRQGNLKTTRYAERIDTMPRLTAVALAVSFALIIPLAPRGLSAQDVGQTKEIAPGILLKTLSEEPTNIPGFEKVRIVEVTVLPGASLPDGTKMDFPMFCTVLQGAMTFSVDGVETRYKAGDSYTCRAGQKFQGKNTGSEPYMERMHWLMPAGQR